MDSSGILASEGGAVLEAPQGGGHMNLLRTMLSAGQKLKEHFKGCSLGNRTNLPSFVCPIYGVGKGETTEAETLESTDD